MARREAAGEGRAARAAFGAPVARRRVTAQGWPAAPFGSRSPASALAAFVRGARRAPSTGLAPRGRP